MNKVLINRTISPIFITLLLSFFWLVFKLVPSWHFFYGQTIITSLLIVFLVLLYDKRSGIRIYGLKKVSLRTCFIAISIAFTHTYLIILLNLHYLHVYSQGGTFQNPPIIMLYLCAIVFTPIEEELIYRGYLQTKLAHLSHKGIRIFNVFINIPILVAAFIFAFCHIGFYIKGFTWLNFTYILLNPFLFGIFSGYFKEKTGSIYPSIIMHSTANLSVMLVLTFLL
jgi:uncharacterized protein